MIFQKYINLQKYIFFRYIEIFFLCFTHSLFQLREKKRMKECLHTLCDDDLVISFYLILTHLMLNLASLDVLWNNSDEQ